MKFKPFDIVVLRENSGKITLGMIIGMINEDTCLVDVDVDINTDMMGMPTTNYSHVTTDKLTKWNEIHRLLYDKSNIIPKFIA